MKMLLRILDRIFRVPSPLGVHEMVGLHIDLVRSHAPHTLHVIQRDVGDESPFYPLLTNQVRVILDHRGVVLHARAYDPTKDKHETDLPRVRGGYPFGV